MVSSLLPSVNVGKERALCSTCWELGGCTGSQGWALLFGVWRLCEDMDSTMMIVMFTDAVPLHFQFVMGIRSTFREEVATVRSREALLDVIRMESRRVDERDEDQDDITMTPLNGTLPGAVIHVRDRNVVRPCSSDLSCAALCTLFGLLTISFQFSFTKIQLFTE